MITIKKLIEDNVINKSQLVLTRYEYIGIDSAQAKMLSRLFKEEDAELDYSNITIDQISNKIKIDLEATKIIIQLLIEKKIINVNNDSKLTFDFNPLIQKLIKTYQTPLDSDSIETKIIWVKNMLNFKLSNDNLDEIKKMIDSGKWNQISIVVNEICDDTKTNWPLFVTMVSSLSNKKSEIDLKLKSILNQNWLD